MTNADPPNRTEDMNDGLLYLWKGLRDIKSQDFASLQGVSVQKVSLGSSHGAVLTTEGAVYMFGNNDRGQLGTGQTGDSRSEPVLLDVPQGLRFTAVSCGSAHTAAVTNTGDVYSWGDNRSSQCGTARQSTDSHITLPQKVTFLQIAENGQLSGSHGDQDVGCNAGAGTKIVKIACGSQHTVALSQSGDLWSWGSGRALGLLTKMETGSPEIVPFLQNRDVVGVACGASHTIALVRSLRKDSHFTRRRPPRKLPWTSAGSNREFEDQSLSGQAGNRDAQRKPSDVSNSDVQRDSCAVCYKQACPLGFRVQSCDSRRLQPSPVKTTKQDIRETCFNEPSDTSGSSRSPSLSSVTTPPNVASSSGFLPAQSPSESTQPKSLKHRPQSLDRITPPLVGPEGSQPGSPLQVATPGSPFMQKMGSFFQRVSSQPMQEMVTNITSSVVSNIKTSMNKIGLTEEGEEGLVQRQMSPATEKLRRFGSLELEEVQGEDVSHQLNIPKSKSTVLSHPLMEEPAEPRRKLSLPHSVNISSTSDESRVSPRDVVVFETEVWSWGDNQHGQLGHGDTLDRSQPCQIQELNDKGVQEISTSADHNIALTVDSHVYAWGRNDFGQLGHSKPLTTTPVRIKPLGGAPVWAAAAGEVQSLLLADGSGYCPEIFYAGKLPKCSPPGSPEQVDQFTFLRMPWNNFWIKALSSSGDTCGCVGDKNMTGLIATLHEFAATERVFHQMVEMIQQKFIKTIIEAVSTESVALGQVMDVLSLLQQSLAVLCAMVAVNHFELTQVIRGEIPLKNTQLVSDNKMLVSAFMHYMQCVGNLRVIKGLHLIRDHCAISAVVLTELGYRSYLHGNAELDTQTLLELPLSRVGEYKQLFEKLALGYAVCTNEHALIHQVSQSWKTLKTSTTKDRNLVDNTRAFWDMMAADYAEDLERLRTPSRRVHRQGSMFVLEGRKKNRTFALFNDILVYFKKNSLSVYNLDTLWVEIIPDSRKMTNGLNLVTPEETLTVVAVDRGDWYCAFCDAVGQNLGAECRDTVDHQTQTTSTISVPSVRHAVHEFTDHPMYKGSMYEGYWADGKLHGEGRLMWPDGRGFIGKFQHGSFEYGMYAVPGTSSMPELQIGNWRDWKLHGSGEIRYANGDEFKGNFLDGKRYGHGVLSQEDNTQYIGEWTNDKRNGYGVEVRTTEMYMGMWSDDQKHGGGVMVTLDDLYFEGNFNYNNMNGLGLLITEDGMCYEGQFSGGLFSLSGYGKITFPNADYIEGRFQGTFTGGITVNGTLRKAQHERDFTLLSDYKHDVEHRVLCFGKLGVPADRKWADIFSACYNVLGCGLNQHPSEVCSDAIWKKLIKSVEGKVDVLDFLSVRELPQDSEGGIRQLSRRFGLDDDLLTIPPVTHKDCALSLRTFHKIRSYLDKAFGCVIHPLGRLMSELIVAFTTTYDGQGLHPRLLHYAVQEVRAIVLGVYNLVRLMFRCLPDPTEIMEPLRRTLSHDGSYSITDHSGSTEDLRPVTTVTAGEQTAAGEPIRTRPHKLHHTDEEVCVTPEALLHPRLMPEVYPTLFNLYALYHTKDDDMYWSRLERWNKKPDIAIMVYLGIESQYWKSDSMDFDTVEPDSPVWKFKGVNSTNHCYTQAVDTLQNITTAYSPMEKLQVLKSTFVEITNSLGEGELLGQDLLFPIFTFVVLRAKIRQLGAEIHFIEDLMEPGLKTGELGHMITDLTASYHYLKTEDDRKSVFNH